MNLIDGKQIAAQIRTELREQTARFEETYGKKVGLAVVLVGEDPASQVYVRNKIRGCEEAGIRSFAHYLPADAPQSAVEELVSDLAADDAVHGILVQLPLPAHLDAERILARIPASKDVDGFPRKISDGLRSRKKARSPVRRSASWSCFAAAASRRAASAPL